MKQLQNTDLKSTMAMRYLSTQIDQLAEYGYSQAQSLAFLNLTKTTLDDPNLRIDILAVEALYQDAARVLNDPNLGLRVGHSFRISHYTQTGKIYSFCADLKQVIAMNAKYQCIAIDAGIISYENEEWSDEYGHFMCLKPYENVRECHHVLNMIAGAYATTFKWLSWGSGKKLKSISFNQKKPADMSVFNKFYDCPLFFSQESVGIEFDEDAIKAPLVTHNAEKLAAVVSMLDRVLETHSINESLEAAVRASIRAALDMGHVSLPIIAARLSLSERELRQNLKDADLKYRDLLEEERQNIFQELYDGGETFSVISQALCYNDQAAFNRAFRRWYGVTPSQYVRSLNAR